MWAVGLHQSHARLSRTSCGESARGDVGEGGMGKVDGLERLIGKLTFKMLLFVVGMMIGEETSVSRPSAKFNHAVGRSAHVEHQRRRRGVLSGCLAPRGRCGVVSSACWHRASLIPVR